MDRLLAIFVLFANYGKDVMVSGARATAAIMRGGKSVRPGLVHMSYGDLGDTAANLLAAFITLTPGTTTVDIDLGRGELVLHLLDSERAEATLALIEQDFVGPIRTIFGARA